MSITMHTTRPESIFLNQSETSEQKKIVRKIKCEEKTDLPPKK